MKFVESSHFADPDTAARKLVEIANAVEAVQDGRIGFLRRSFWPVLRRWNWRALFWMKSNRMGSAREQRP